MKKKLLVAMVLAAIGSPLTAAENVKLQFELVQVTSGQVALIEKNYGCVWSGKINSVDGTISWRFNSPVPGAFGICEKLLQGVSPPSSSSQ